MTISLGGAALRLDPLGSDIVKASTEQFVSGSIEDDGKFATANHVEHHVIGRIYPPERLTRKGKGTISTASMS